MCFDPDPRNTFHLATMNRQYPYAEQLGIIIDHLEKYMFSSKAVIEIDSIVSSSLFGQYAKKKNDKKVHTVQTLSKKCIVDKETRDLIYNTYEAGKKKLVFTDPTRYLETAKEMAMTLYRGSSTLKSYGNESKTVTEWCGKFRITDEP